MSGRSLIPSAAAMSDFSQFFTTDVGSRLLTHQRQNIELLLSKAVGYNCLQLSVSKSAKLYDAGQFGHYVQLGYAPAVAEQQRDHVWTEYERLPIASNCIDAVILHHVMDFSSQPHDILREVDRVLYEGGYLLVVSFKPWGGWEAYKRYLQFRNKIHQSSLRLCKPVTRSRLHDWLTLLNYEVLQSRSSYFDPSKRRIASLAVKSPALRRNLGKVFGPLGVYQICMARKQTHSANLIGTKWNVRKPSSAPAFRVQKQGLEE